MDEKMLSLEQEIKIKEKALKLKEEKKLRKMSIRKFRKMIYADHFDKNYLELEQKKKELENRISFALQAGKFEEAGKYCDDLEQIINQM